MSIIALQLCFLIGLIVRHQMAISHAPRILLQASPVDPESPFRGKYMSLHYTLSTVSPHLLKDCTPKHIKKNTPVYVVLEKKNTFWEPAALYSQKPTNPRHLFLTGELRSSPVNETGLDIHYGIESFFLSEQAVETIEQKIRDAHMRIQDEQETTKNKHIEALDEEAKRIFKADISDYWFEKLNGEIDAWTAHGYIEPCQAARLKHIYPSALRRIDRALSSREKKTPIEPPCFTIEVAVTKNGKGYPLRLFWDGKEYR